MLYTARIQELYKTLPELLNFLQARVRRVEAPTVSVKAFGIEAARKARNADNQSGLEAALKRVLQNVAANAAGLAKKGQQPADTQKLQDVYDALVDDTTNQGASMSTQKNLTQDNLGVLNHLFAAMQHLLADGKALYAASNRAETACCRGRAGRLPGRRLFSPASPAPSGCFCSSACVPIGLAKCCAR